jgi:DNA-binding transcriptional MerR regulator
MGGTVRSRINGSAPNTALKIGEVAERVGVAVGTIRYYESLGLIKPDYRSESGYRYYGPEAVRRLQFIKKAQCLEFSLNEIQQVLGVRNHGDPACLKVRELLECKIAELDAQIVRLQTLKVELESYRERWQDRPLDNPDTEELCSLIAEVSDGHPTTHEAFRSFS